MHAPDSLFHNAIDKLKEWKFYFIEPNPVNSNVGVLTLPCIELKR